MISHCEPMILKHISEHNKCCMHIGELIKRKRVPSGIVPTLPEKIDPKKLFSLNVDDTLWQDVGLEDKINGIPGWLGNENIQEGINPMLERDRAKEELAQVAIERTKIQTWLREEWESVTAALALSECKGVAHDYCP
jgi:hypothetical protein